MLSLVTPDPIRIGALHSLCTASSSFTSTGHPVAVPVGLHFCVSRALASPRGSIASLTRQDDAVRQEELGCVNCLGERDVPGYGVRAVLLLDIRENEDIFSVNALPITQDISGACISESFVGDVREHKAFRSNELQVGGLRNSERLAVRACQNLNTARRLRRQRPPYLAANSSH